jgi:hypothetical protein
MLQLGLELGARDFRLWLLVAAARSKGSDSGVGLAYERAVPHRPNPSPRAACASASCADAGARTGCDV